jgi:CelD/BcsL family acetyltransferase involved in cellulose biosynthesis
MSVRAIDTLDGLEAIRPFWELTQNHLNNDYGQFRLVCATRPEVVSPLVIVVERAGVPVAALLCRLEDVDFAPTIGYFRPMRLGRRVIAVLHRGVLGDLDAAAAASVVGFLRLLMQAGVADAVSFHPLAEHSALAEALAHKRTRPLAGSGTRWVVHREMALDWIAGRFADHKLNAKHRSSFRRRERDLTAAYPNRVTWHWLSSFDESLEGVAALCARLETIAARTYQRGLGTGFFDDEEHRRRFTYFASRGLLRVMLLEVDGRPGAFWYGIVYHGVFHAAETGYDPALGRFEVGTLLLARLVDELVAEGVTAIDFGIGDAPYKARFCDRSWREATLELFAPTPRGAGMRVLRSICGSLDAAARQVAEQAGITGRLKSLWRRRVRPVHAPAAPDPAAEMEPAGAAARGAP